MFGNGVLNGDVGNVVLNGDEWEYGAEW